MQPSLFDESDQPPPPPVVVVPGAPLWTPPAADPDDDFFCPREFLGDLDLDGPEPDRGPFVPRPYQDAARAAVWDVLATRRSCFIKLPTGTGKTSAFAMVVADALAMFPGRAVVILAHRDELIRQAVRTVRWVCPDADVRVEQAERYASLDPDPLFPGPVVVVASVATLCRDKRIRRFDPNKVSIVIVDEAHHCVPRNRTYFAIVKHFRAAPGCKFLGVSATPDRGDFEALGQVFEMVAYDMAIETACEDGWLVEPYQKLVTDVRLDLDALGLVKDDLNLGELERVLTQEEVLQGMCGVTYRLANLKGEVRPTLFFATRVAHAEKAALVFNRIRRKAGLVGPAAFAMSGAMDMADRRKLIAAHERGEFQFLCVCGLCDEGFDSPWTRVVVPRPTLVRSRYEQMVGRALRPLPGVVDGLGDAAARRAAIASSTKRRALVVDFAGNSRKHKLITVGDILGGRVTGEVGRRPQRPPASPKNPLAAEIVEANRAADAATETRRSGVVLPVVGFRAVEVNPFTREADPPPPARAAPPRQPTDRQAAYLSRMGVKTKGLTRQAARALIDELRARRKRGLCTHRQREVLHRCGWARWETDALDFDDARAAIDALKANGWKRPPAAPPPPPESEAEAHGF